MRPTPHVVDASVVVPLILPAPGDDDHLGLDALIDDPDVDVLSPMIMDLEVLNVAARRWGLSEDQLVRLVGLFDRDALASAIEGEDSGRGIRSYFYCAALRQHAGDAWQRGDRLLYHALLAMEQEAGARYAAEEAAEFERVTGETFPGEPSRWHQ